MGEKPVYTELLFFLAIQWQERVYFLYICELLDSISKFAKE